MSETDEKGITFRATFHRLSIDKEGQSQVTFTVPQSDLQAVNDLSSHTEEVLSIAIVPTGSTLS